MTGCDIGDNCKRVLAGVCVCVCGFVFTRLVSRSVHVHMGTADLRGYTCKQTLHSNRGHLRGDQRTLIFHSF